VGCALLLGTLGGGYTWSKGGGAGTGGAIGVKPTTTFDDGRYYLPGDGLCNIWASCSYESRVYSYSPPAVIRAPRVHKQARRAAPVAVSQEPTSAPVTSTQSDVVPGPTVTVKQNGRWVQVKTWIKSHVWH